MLPVIELPWPSGDLGPNGRVHWRTRWKLTQAARALAKHTARNAGLKAVEARPMVLSITFFPPGNYHFDDDNLIGRVKAYRDGIADAAGVDDALFKLAPVRRAEKRKGGMVRFEIEAA